MFRQTKIDKNRIGKNKRHDFVWGYLFILPWLIGFFLLTVWPMMHSFYLSLTQYNLLQSPVWVGFANYYEMFTDDRKFIQSLQVTFQFVLLSVPLKLAFALFIAMLLRKATMCMSLYRSVYYLPSLLGGSVAISIIWRNLFDSDGRINVILHAFGIQGKDWINSPDTSLYTLILLATWQFGASMVIFLAGLNQIPKDLYEAASIDGASGIRTFVTITVPMLTPILLFNLVMQTIGSFQMFTQAYVVTQGGPINSTLVYALYLYQKAFTYFSMGYASALAWILLLLVALFTSVLFASSKKWVHYEN